MASAGWSYRYRLLIRPPPPSIPLVVRQPKINNYILLSIQTSDLLRTASSPDFSEETSIAAFNRDMRHYAEINGPDSATVMQNRLIFNFYGPTTYLKSFQIPSFY